MRISDWSSDVCASDLGVKDADGIPDATMADGTPNGHATLKVSQGGRYALAWHPARLRGDDQAFPAAMALHAPKVLRAGTYPAWGVYANVFMGRDRQSPRLNSRH